MIINPDMTTETKSVLTSYHQQAKKNASATSNLVDRKIEIKHSEKVSMLDRTAVVKYRYPTNGLYGLL